MNGELHNKEGIPMLLLMFSLFITSLSLFVFQIVLTRLLSPMLQYHYVFLLTSLAIFGLGIGGLITYKLSIKNTIEQMKEYLPVWLFLLAASYIIVFVLIFKLPYMNFIYVYSILAIFPYIIGGMFISSVFHMIPSKSNRLYFSDLIGSALGSMVVIYFLNDIGVTNTVLLISWLVALSSISMAYVIGRRPLTIISMVFAAAILLTGTFQQSIGNFELKFNGYFSSPSTLLASYRAANTNAFLEDRVWDAFSMTDLIKFGENESEMTIIMDGGSNSRMIRIEGDISEYQALKDDLNYLPFTVGKQDKVLLIGPGGGLDVVLALLGGSKEIDAVEINAGSVELVKKYSEYNGNIYNRDNVNVYIQDGRNFVKETDKKYDTIYLSQVMTGTADTVGYALAENFIYTKEAVKDYFNSLNSDGKLAFILHDAQDLTRMIFTALETLKEIGIPKEHIAEHFIVINRAMSGNGNHQAIHYPLLLISKSPFSLEQVEQINNKAEENNHLPLYVPGMTENNPVRVFMDHYADPDALYSQLTFNAKPTSDNKPFFFDFNKGISPILLILLAVVAVIASLFLRSLAKNRKLRKPSLYFMGLGLAYMLVEIPLSQKFSLLLGHPSRSFVVIMTALLLGSGLGSLFGGLKIFRRRNRYIPLLIVTLLIITVNMLSTAFIDQWFIPSLNARVIITFLSLLPLGFFMGMPFPFGLKAISMHTNDNSIPLVWGINGILSVGGSVLGVIMSMKLGFSFSLGLGALIYLLLFVFMPFTNSPLPS